MSKLFCRMAGFRCSAASVLLVLLLVCSADVLRCASQQVRSSQAWSLLRLQRLLGDPPALAGWNNYTDPCYGDDAPSPTVVCYGDSVTQLRVSGAPGTPPLPRAFSLDSFFTTLTRLPDLRVLSLSSVGLWGALPGPKLARLRSLEIIDLSSNFLYGPLPDELASLTQLQTLVLDHNMFTGRVPPWLGGFPRLAVLSARNNSLSGPLPESLGDLVDLRVLALSSNSLAGPLPDLAALTNLQVLDVGDNYLGPQFPALGNKVSTVVLRNNRFTGGLPAHVSSYHLLQRLDIAHNRFVGPLPPSLLSLPSIRYLDVAGNRFTGMLFSNTSCNDGLDFVDLSSNLLTGTLPACLAGEKSGKNVSYAMNCLSNRSQRQHPYAFCRNEALAVGVLPRKHKNRSSRKAIVAGSVVAGVIAAAMVAAFLVVFALRRADRRNAVKRPPRRLVEHASNGYPSKLLSDARYISQAMKLGALGLPSYRSFSLEELEAATNNFDTSAFMDEGCHGQMYKGKLNDPTLVAIRCLKLKRSHSSHNFTRHIELFAKLRHRHLVSALGHCFEYYLEDSTVSRLFLVFEYVTNGTLRSNVCEGVAGQKLTWTQRISAAIGVAKGIQFLHAGIIPGLFANGLKTTNVLLDQNLVAKISSYNLPIISENMRTEMGAGGYSSLSKEDNGRAKDGEKIDIYDFGVILLEIISGSPVTFQKDVDEIKDKLQTSATSDGATRRRGIVDPAVRRACCDESLKTMIEICMRCLSLDPTKRPSIEDVLWNLQFAAQVQDAWRGDSQSSDGSAVSPSHTPQSVLNAS
ncbi:hypothetical protein Taro_006990 [Colocasia esculenta]|uniref:Protein kinase domain-containing protein n=1 Tax=Colocasia esculenta TaxID=4460 RepID=A0A843TWV1_COLES|nr:hypothetical protein [Colocasia esculenta]